MAGGDTAIEVSLHARKEDGSNVSRPKPIKAITLLPNVPETWLPHLARGTERTAQRTR
jgi:hypothetical protein